MNKPLTLVALTLVACSSITDKKIDEIRNEMALHAAAATVTFTDTRELPDGDPLDPETVLPPGTTKIEPRLGAAQEAILSRAIDERLTGEGGTMHFEIEVLQASVEWGANYAQFGEAHVRLRVVATNGSIRVDSEGKSWTRREYVNPRIADGLRLLDEVLVDAFSEFLVRFGNRDKLNGVTPSSTE